MADSNSLPNNDDLLDDEFLLDDDDLPDDDFLLDDEALYHDEWSRRIAAYHIEEARRVRAWLDSRETEIGDGEVSDSLLELRDALDEFDLVMEEWTRHLETRDAPLPTIEADESNRRRG